MNNKILFTAGAVLVIGAIAGWVVLGKGGGKEATSLPTTTQATAGTSTTPANGEKVMMSYTDTGFSPQTVTVKQGTTVEFVNTSSGQMWVASGEHPTHKLLPGFDELASVGRGGTYDYTFVKIGTWPLHNHMNPSDMGTVIVQ